MLKNPKKLWITVFVLGWLFDLLFWDQEPGINVALFLLACFAGALFLLLGDGIRPGRATLLLVPVFLFFAGFSFVRAEPMTAFLAYLFCLFSLGLIAVTYRGGRWTQYSLADYVLKFTILAISALVRGAMFAAETRKSRSEADASPRRGIAAPVVRGLLIALPVVVFFSSLLASADAVFNQQLENFIRLFRIENLPEYIVRLLLILLAGYALAGVVRHAASESTDAKLVGQEKAWIPPFLGFTEAAIVLGSVVALFAAFVVIQFQYFFGGAANIHVAGYTYAEYARRGFGELVAVAFFALLLLLGLSAITRRALELQRRIFSGLGVALVALLLVMLFSAYQRLNLYEIIYGFSRLRTYTHVFLVWIGLLLVATIVLELLRKERAFALAMLTASLGFAISLTLLNVDGFIVQQNIRRELGGNAAVDLDAQYFSELSDDAVPVLAAALGSPDLPAQAREKVGAALVCMQYGRGEMPAAWQSFHLARWQASQALEKVSGMLEDYRIDSSTYPQKVTAPSGQEYGCSRGYGE